MASKTRRGSRYQLDLKNTSEVKALQVFHEPDDSVMMMMMLSLCVCVGHGVFHSSDTGESSISRRLQEDPRPGGRCQL